MHLGLYVVEKLINEGFCVIPCIMHYSSLPKSASRRKRRCGNYKYFVSFFEKINSFDINYYSFFSLVT